MSDIRPRKCYRNLESFHKIVSTLRNKSRYLIRPKKRNLSQKGGKRISQRKLNRILARENKLSPDKGLTRVQEIIELEDLRKESLDRFQKWELKDTNFLDPN